MAKWEPFDYMQGYRVAQAELAVAKQEIEQLKATLHDQFAMAALQSVVCCTDPTIEDCKNLAEVAYALADAMMEARKEPTK